jgi:Ran GTPase-activating protein 1
VSQVADFADIFTGRLISEIPDALKALCDAVEHKSTLVEINLSDNAFGVRSVEPLRNLLENNRFEILRLNNNGLGPEAGILIANWLKKSAELSKEKGLTSNLKTVICGRNRLENGSAPAWAGAFAEHGTLVDVRLPQNAIWTDGIQALAEGLSKCPNLRYLDLQDNTFIKDESKAAVNAWAHALPKLSVLETLIFSDCVLSEEDDDEVPPLLETLAEGSNPNLVTLVLQNNNLSVSTFKFFTNSLTSLPKLRRLDLQWNDVDEDSEDAIDALREIMEQRSGKLMAFKQGEEEEEESEEGEEGEEEEEEEEEREEGGVEDAEEEVPSEEPQKPEGDVSTLTDIMSKVTVH